jgi:hypothetical protein
MEVGSHLHAPAVLPPMSPLVNVGCPCPSQSTRAQGCLCSQEGQQSNDHVQYSTYYNQPPLPYRATANDVASRVSDVF